jgi:hypothetical protein
MGETGSRVWSGVSVLGKTGSEYVGINGGDGGWETAGVSVLVEWEKVGVD